MDKLTRCAIYIRVSTEEQAIHGLSLDAQKKDLTDYAKHHNYEIVDYYIDEGKTARKKLSNRKELTRMLSDVKDGKIDLIIFTKLDRWFRNVKDYYKVQEVLEKYNVNWKTTKENYDTGTANGRLHINIMLSVAQDEADRTSERIKAVFENKLKNKEPISGSLPIGYKIENKRVVIDDEKKELALDVFNLYYLYHSQYEVLLKIIDKYGVSLCEKTIKRMLQNKIYIGEYRGYPNFCEPLIEQSKFDEIQKILISRSKTPSKTGREFVFTGLLVCKECQHKLIANTQVRPYGRKEYVSYKCHQYYIRHICNHSKIIYEHNLEDYIINNLENELIKYQHLTSTGKTKKKEQKINKSQIKNKLEKLKELYINDLIDIDMYKKDYDKYMNILNSSNQEENSQKDYSHIESFLKSNYKDIYYQLSKKERRVLLSSVIKEIVIDKENKINITFK